MGMALILSHWAFWVALIAYLAVLIGLRYLTNLRWQPAFWLRIVLVFVTLVVAFWPSASLAGYTLPQREIAVLDLSDTTETAQQERAVLALRLWQEASTNRLVIVFAAHPSAPATPAGWLAEATFGSALDTAARLFSTQGGRLLVISGGAFAVEPEVETMLTTLKTQGVQVDFVPLEAQTSNVPFVSIDLNVPSVLWADVPALAEVTSLQGTDTLTLLINGQPAERYADDLWLIPSQAAGITTLEVRGTQDGVTYVGARFAAIEVLAAPHVLLVSQVPDAASGLVSSLNNQGIAVDVIAPEELPDTLSPMLEYQVVFLHDVLANRLTLEQMKTLESFVARLGRGLVVIGGRNTYTLGGYKGTPLENLLPLSLEAPLRGTHSPITFVMVLDRSGSMTTSGENESGLWPIDLAREAAIRSVESLSATDNIGVLTYSTQSTWDVEIRELGSGLELREVQDEISQIFAAGGTNMYGALATALEAIDEFRDTDTVHILLLSDGVSFDGSLSEFQALAGRARVAGITISTIALGQDSDPNTMAVIAQEGNGRFFEVIDADQLPEIMIAESIAARSEFIQLGVTNAVPPTASLHPALFGVGVVALPRITGYLALTEKEGAGVEVLLVSGNLNDPLLASWQFGLGRVIAWTSDLGGEWAPRWDQADVFWAQVARYGLPNPALNPVEVNIETDADTLSVNFIAQTYEGIPINFAELPVFTYRDIAGELQTFTLPQVAPGTYKLQLPLPPEGTYRALISYAGAAGAETRPAPFAVNDPASIIPVSAQTAEQNLENWTTLTEGRTLAIEEIFDVETSEASGLVLDWRTAMLAILLAYWVFEIAARRRWMPWYA